MLEGLQSTHLQENGAQEEQKRRREQAKVIYHLDSTSPS